jgi:DNA-directed RNA polymerase specialized sigma24 family protein
MASTGLAMENESPGSEETVVDALEKLPAETLFEVWRSGGSFADWNSEFSKFVDEVEAVVRASFPNNRIAASAVQSAMATFLRRARDGELDRIDGPKSLFGYVVLRAHHKAWEKLKRDWAAGQLPLDFDLADPRPGLGEPEPGDTLLVIAAIRAEMAYQLNLALKRMGLLLRSEHQRCVFELVYRSMYEPEKLSVAEIAERCDVAERTVGRVRSRVKKHWPYLLEEARRAVREFGAGLPR